MSQKIRWEYNDKSRKFNEIISTFEKKAQHLWLLNSVTLIARCRTQKIRSYAKVYYLVIYNRLMIGTLWPQPDKQHIQEKYRFYSIRCWEPPTSNVLIPNLSSLAIYKIYQNLTYTSITYNLLNYFSFFSRNRLRLTKTNAQI